ncbi:conserved Plasmodium protein, unknown function [Plasmodium gallinaceum]|uniref:Uncharacterized protein n=1 Tax=Plasmodium gallinaceum TaxID=5849 RepID=A0A1J1GR10_PLAGA|nr:conserved Plasmodium protein, unknown function [Plasmodium gallinaceum]CRG93474.1 conserved Plasmodium protein, unknown function [Plasmodium gallinaceum]
MMNFSNNVNLTFENDKKKISKKNITFDEIDEDDKNEKKYVNDENNSTINPGINDFINENVNDERFNHSFISKDFIKNIGICYNIINEKTIFEKDSSFTKISNIIELRIKQIIEEANKFFLKRKKYCVNKFLNIDDFTNSCHYLNKEKLKNDNSENQKEKDENKIKEISDSNEKDKVIKRENNDANKKKDDIETKEIHNEEKKEKYKENGNFYNEKESDDYKDIKCNDYINNYDIKNELESKELKCKESKDSKNEENLTSNYFNSDDYINVCEGIKEENVNRDSVNDEMKSFEEKEIKENCDINKCVENNYTSYMLNEKSRKINDNLFSEEIINKNKLSNDETELNENRILENNKMDEKKKEENKKKKNSKLLTIKKKKTLDMKINKENNLLYNSYINSNENKKKNILNFILSDMQNSLPAEPNLTIFWLFIQNNYKKKKKDKDMGRKELYFNYQCYEILYTIEKKNEHKKKKKKDDILNHHYFKYNNIFLLPKFYPINKEYTILSKYILEIIKDIINYRINFFDYNNILHIFSTSKEINKILTNILFFIFNELDHNLRFNNIYASLMLLILLNGIIKNRNIDIDFYCLQILKMLIHVIIYEHELKLKNIYSILLLKRKACDIINDFCCILRKKNNSEIINIDSYLIYISSKLLTHNKCTYMHIYISYYLIYLMPINIHIKFFLSFTPNFLYIFFKKYLYYQNVYNSFLSYEQKEMNELFNFFFFHIYTLIQGSLYRIFKSINILIINSSLSNYLKYLLNFIIDYADYHLPLILSILNILCKNSSVYKNRSFLPEKKYFFDIMTIKNYEHNKNNLKKKKNYLKNVQEINNFYLNEENSDQDDSYFEDYLNDEDLNKNEIHNTNDKKQYFNAYIKKRTLLNKTLLKKNLEKNHLQTNIAVNNVLNQILNKFESNNKSSYLSNKYSFEDFLYESSYYFLYTF